jgi:hypothetical protein
MQRLIKKRNDAASVLFYVWRCVSSRRLLQQVVPNQPSQFVFNASLSCKQTGNQFLRPWQLKRARLAAEARKKKEQERLQHQVRCSANRFSVLFLTHLQSLARIQCAVRQKTARAVFKQQKLQHAGLQSQRIGKFIIHWLIRLNS